MSQVKTDNDKKISTYVIRLVADVINGVQPTENEQSLDWKQIIDFAQKQSVLNIVAYACEKLKEKPDAETMKFLKEFRMQKIVVEAQQEIEFCDVMDKLEELAVRHLPLKGYIIKNLYPSPDMRTMGDLDIIIDESECERVIRVLEAEGFRRCGSGDLHSNIERGNAYIELHHSMVDKEHTTLNEYFGNGFARAKPTSGYSFRFELSHEDLYIFLIAHIAKHYRYSGTGIRSILDLYVYRKMLPDMDHGYIRRELEKIGLDVFCEKAEKIADDWYSGDFDGEFDSVSSYIVSGGVYGTENAQVANSFIHDNSNVKGKKIANWFRTVFPGKELMSTRYPVLKKHIWLLPLFWIVRFFDTLIHTPQNFKKSVKNSTEILKIDDDLISAQRDSGIRNL